MGEASVVVSRQYLEIRFHLLKFNKKLLAERIDEEKDSLAKKINAFDDSALAATEQIDNFIASEAERLFQEEKVGSTGFFFKKKYTYRKYHDYYFSCFLNEIRKNISGGYLHQSKLSNISRVIKDKVICNFKELVGCASLELAHPLYHMTTSERNLRVGYFVSNDLLYSPIKSNNEIDYEQLSDSVSKLEAILKTDKDEFIVDVDFYNKIRRVIK